MPRSIDGHGFVIASSPPPISTVSPRSFRISAVMPGNARVAEPGLVFVIPGSGVIMVAPVSVCHHVSTIGHRALPITCWYQIHASGVIASPTEPDTPNNDTSRRLGQRVPPLPPPQIARRERANDYNSA